MTYLMESETEADRLIKKSDEESTRQQLELTGLKSGMKALDAGGGAGFVTRIMSQIVGKTGQVVLADGSQDRIEFAKKYLADFSNVSTSLTDLEQSNLPADSFDYIFCRFVFEYLSKPQVVLNEFIRLAKPGGRIVVGDLDNNILSHYPIPVDLEEKYVEVIRQLQGLQLWDPYVGRKIFNFFYQAGLQNIKVHLIPHHLIYGRLEQRDRENMQAKLNQIQSLAQKGVLKINFDVPDFIQRFMEFFEKEDRFSYSPLIIVEADKPQLQ